LRLLNVPNDVSSWIYNWTHILAIFHVYINLWLTAPDKRGPVQEFRSRAMLYYMGLYS